MVWAASVGPGDLLDELETSKQEALDCAQEAARGARSVAGMADIARRSLLRPKGVFQVSRQLVPGLPTPAGRAVAPCGGVSCWLKCWADERALTRPAELKRAGPVPRAAPGGHGPARPDAQPPAGGLPVRQLGLGGVAWAMTCIMPGSAVCPVSACHSGRVCCPCSKDSRS